MLPRGLTLLLGLRRRLRATRGKEKGGVRLMLLKKLGSERLTSSVRPPLPTPIRAPCRLQRLAYDGEVQVALSASELWDRS